MDMNTTFSLKKWVRFIAIIIPVLVSAVIWGCATTISAEDDDIVPEARLLSEYLVGSYANYIDDAYNRSVYYSKAYRRVPDNTILARRAITSAITAGDSSLSYTLAKEIHKRNKQEPVARGLLGVEAFKKGQYSKALAYADLDDSDLTLQIFLDLLKGWVRVAQNDMDGALETFDTLSGGPYFAALGEVMKANVLARSGQYEEALALLGSEKIETYEMAFGAIAPIEMQLEQARILSSAGHLDEARQRLEAFDALNDGFETGPVRAYLDQLEAGQPINVVLTPQQMMARMLTESAYDFFARNHALDVAEVYLRLALELDPDHDKAKLWLGSLIERTDRWDEVMAIYRSVPDSSSYMVASKLSEANAYFHLDEDDKALSVLEETNNKQPVFATREALGRARIFRENYAEALPIYDALVKSMSPEELKANPEPLYYRAICHERLNQWDAAVADFKTVLELDPDHSQALNYLGYTWVDREENINEAFEMIHRAVQLEPESGAIIDSLGWAYYKLGQYEEARTNLEKATELEPYSATIIDHLGDVYWKLGRFREAGYQWNRALQAEPTDEERDNIKVKLEGGLEAVEATKP